MSNLDNFISHMAKIGNTSELGEVKRNNKIWKVVNPTYTRRIVTITGIKTAKGRFLPVSHEGHGIETYIDKVELLNKTRAEFIARKQKGIERRAHMALFRELIEQNQLKDELKEKSEEEKKRILASFKSDWQKFFTNKLGKKCIIPDSLCIACWNCSLYGGLDTDRNIATFSRIRYFDTYSVEDIAECVATLESEEGMGIGNQVYEDMSKERGSDTYHLYEYVKAGTRFPFITIIESPTLLDVAGYLYAVRRADEHGYGKYSANHGKFDTKFLTVATGYPRFSVLDMLEWAEAGTLKESFDKRAVKFDDLNGCVTLVGDEIENLASKLPEAFNEYYEALNR